MADIIALAKERDRWIDRWLTINQMADARRILQEYLLDGRHRETMPSVLVAGQEKLMTAINLCQGERQQ